ncbi:MAG TPA: molybdate ABC transporter substrate-binding protein, partial [Ktedonobacterales bacterium]|nr:molybdate ABC transporter substrate-binding protein [Ktedonobacterales bacterium]
MYLMTRIARRHRTAVRKGLPLVCALALLCALAGCGISPSRSASGQPIKLTVFAAASLKGAFTDIGAAYRKAHPDVSITFNFAGSDTLAQQIIQGAPADLFASANTQQMDVVVKSSDIVGSGVSTFAHNRLVLIYPAANPAHIQTLRDIARPGVKLDLAARSVPVGQYTLDFLDKASADPTFGPSYKTRALKNVVSYETDVKAVLAKVALGEADAGIVYTTDAATASGRVGTVAIPDALNSIALYPAGVVKTAKQAAAA